MSYTADPLLTEVLKDSLAMIQLSRLRVDRLTHIEIFLLEMCLEFVSKVDMALNVCTCTSA